MKEINKVDPLRGGIGASLLLGHAGIYSTAILVYEARGMNYLKYLSLILSAYVSEKNFKCNKVTIKIKWNVAV